MKRQAIRGLLLFTLVVAVVDSTVSAQNIPDAVTVRDRKDGSTKTHNGLFKLSPTGFEVVTNDKKSVVINPDDIVKIAIGDLQGVDRNAINTAVGKEGNKEYDAARTLYQDLHKKAGLPERSKRYLEFKKVQMTHKIVDDLDAEKGWKEKAEECIKDWTSFLTSDDTKFGWEQWPATRACTRLQIECRKYDAAAIAWGRVSKNANMPPDAKLEAAMQEIDLQIRSKAYSAAATGAAELIKTAAGSKKDRLVIYELAAKAGGSGKPLDGIAGIKAEMNKTKDASVHATGFSMLGELYLAGGKPRDAIWEFAMVDTVLNQDRDEVYKALARLIELFEIQADEDQTKKYQDKLKRFRTTF